jgi:hypothetical protein
MKRSSILLQAGCLILLGCAGEPRKQKELDDRTAPILSGGTKVEVFRIDGGSEKAAPTVIKAGDPTMGGYSILSKGKDQTPEFAARLNDLLTDSRTYTDQYAACFMPGVAFRVWKSDECVDVIICFRCHNFYLGPPSDEKVMENATFSGSSNAGQLIRLAKDAFPDDQEIQALKDK